MTQGIHDMLGLPTLEEILKQNDNTETMNENDEMQVDSTISILKDLSKRLAILEGTDHGESMDELHKEIIQHARDLMAFGFNVDMRSASRVFEIAAMMYGHAITTKDSKRNMQLKTLKIALDKKKLELEERKVNHIIGNGSVASIDGGTVVVEDRNELIKRLREESSK